MSSTDESMSIDSDMPILRVGPGNIYIEILSEPFVVFQYRKYQPAIKVQDTKNKLEYLLLLTAVSLGELLEDFRQEHGSLSGRKFIIRKASSERTSPYELEELLDDELPDD